MIFYLARGISKDTYNSRWKGCGETKKVSGVHQWSRKGEGREGVTVHRYWAQLDGGTGGRKSADHWKFGGTYMYICILMGFRLDGCQRGNAGYNGA